MRAEGTREFSERFGAAPRLDCFSPGRINLIGEHTDYNDGWVLPVAVDLGTRFLVRANKREEIRIASLDYSEQAVIRLDGIAVAAASGQWQDYFVGVLREFLAKPGRVSGLDMTVSSTLPRGGGLSSSAAVTMGLATVLNEVWQRSYGAEDLARIAQRAENNFVGLACGILDPFAIAMGKSAHAILLNCASLEFQYVPFPERYAIVAVHSGVPRQLAGSQYNLRRDECRRALALLQSDTGARSLSDVTLAEIEASGPLRQDPVAYRRARHVVTENTRVRSAAAALRTGDIGAFGKELLASHESLRDDYEVSCKELDLLVAGALSHPGVVGAKMTGAGFGGCIVAIVATEATADFSAYLGSRYRSESRYDAEFHVCRAADGVRCTHAANQ